MQLTREAEAQYQDLMGSFYEGLRPDPILTIAEWAEKHRWLSKEASNEPGKWKGAKVPFMREVMECLSLTSPIKEVAFMKATQVAGTEVGNNFVAYAIDLGLGSIMIVNKTEALSKDYAKFRLRTMIRDCPRLNEKVPSVSRRDGKNTLLRVEYQGGHAALAYAETPATLRSMPMRYVFGDEIDAWPDDPGGEGDPLELAEARTSTFSRSKLFWCSTPTIEGQSKIAKKFEDGDRCYYHVPCPDCDHFQKLVWGNLKYERDDNKNLIDGTVRYSCCECGSLIEEWQKTEMLAEGKWVPTRKSPDPKMRSFHLSSLYAPVGWRKWADLVRRYIRALSDPKRMKSFVNLCLGETWKEIGDAPDWERLYNRREHYEIGTVPNGVVFLTMGVDVQGDRIEYEVVGWGKDRESWSIEYGVIECNPTQKDWWHELDKVRQREWVTESGVGLRIRKTGIDTGYQAHHMYTYSRTRPGVVCVKGKDNLPNIIGPGSRVDINIKGKRVVKRGAVLHMVGTNLTKGETYSFLRLEPPAKGPMPPGYCHFPQHEEEYFKMLTAEQIVTEKNKKGYKVRIWKKTRDRNEALDCRVYARAMATLIGIDRWDDARWKREQAAMGRVAPKRRKRTPKKGYLQGGESTWPGQ